MAFPRLTASTLLASFFLLLYWTISSAQSHDLPSSALSLPNRVKRDQPFETREKVKATFDMVKDTLSGFKDMSEVFKWASSTTNVIKKLSKFASLAPGCVGALFSAVNMVLAFILQDDPVLNAVTEGFAEVNKKLDSISIQISNLATDVEWFNYVSVYSQDELCILNTWTKFNEFLEDSSKFAQNEDEKLQLARYFTNFYKDTKTESSVMNLYHYLTVRSLSLTKNLNRLLSMKFKCDIREISRYNYYFSSLLVKGTVLNEAYWKLTGQNRPNQEAKRAQMFRKVYESQVEAIRLCQKNVKQLVGNDVLEISEALSPDDKTVIAQKVKEALDKKYDWYDWVVLVYNTDDDRNYILYDLAKIPVGKVTVAVDYRLKYQNVHKMEVEEAVKNCFERESCETVRTDKQKCKGSWSNPLDMGMELHHVWLPDYVRATHVIHGSEFVELPKPFYKYGCTWGRSTSQFYMHSSKRMPVCKENPCKNAGSCTRLLDSNDSQCECQDGYYGDTCEEKMDTSWVKKIPVLTITTMNGRLKVI